MITEDEYIGLRETTAAYCALLYSLSKKSFEPQIITSSEARSLVESETGYAFNEEAIVGALTAAKPYRLADRVSGIAKGGAFKLDVSELKQHYINLASSQSSYVWQLENLDHERFRETIGEIRSEAITRYPVHRNYSEPYPALWSDINIWMLDGIFQRKSGRGAKLKVPQKQLFNRGAFAAEWIAVYLAVISLVVTLWIGGKI